MRKRDLAILMLCAFAVFFSLEHEGDFSFKEAWFHLSDEYPIKYDGDRLPPPIVADLNGDGKKEVLVATHDAKIQVLEPHTRRVDGGFSEARVLAEVSLLPDKIRIASGRRAVAMATGVIDRTYKQGQPLKQVLVVVTSGWSVMCFDHNLKKLWDTNLQEDFPPNAHHREIAISISNYTLKHGDTGLVIVGGRMEVQPHAYMDPFEEIGMVEKNAEQHRRSASEKEAADNSGTVNLRYFAFYAFAGRNGALRWSRKNENIEAESSDASRLIPQQNYKLDVHAMNTRHPGEDRREDTQLKLAHFRRHKRKALKKMVGKTTNYPFHKPEENHPPGKDSSKKISNFIGKAANYASSSKTKKPINYIPTITNHTVLWWVPNVVVAHQKEGIEAIHLASGRTICKLHLQEGGLHADINGDGVLDHVQAVGGNGAEQTVVSGSMEVLRPCWAVATSGVPVREQLFNASICQHSPFSLFQHGELRRFGSHGDSILSLQIDTFSLRTRQPDHTQPRSRNTIKNLIAYDSTSSYTREKHTYKSIIGWQFRGLVGWSQGVSTRWMMDLESIILILSFFNTFAIVNLKVVISNISHEGMLTSNSRKIIENFKNKAKISTSYICRLFNNGGLDDSWLVMNGQIYLFLEGNGMLGFFSSSKVQFHITVFVVMFLLVPFSCIYVEKDFRNYIPFS
ncbi:hypothetical protein JRO89_XS08G0139100 [Xanthoceras sorbifolium]|uniref:FG-GAP repeat-containing protein n=1 Tax=Xanthoceras sorbifolium TaxID=99658 RepID=A0ABQ8HPQ0_9ROSI|nr:hypothetical protein JRO89_XS08G0139100 [Xanthoceras sorbifolium]